MPEMQNDKSVIKNIQQVQNYQEQSPIAVLHVPTNTGNNPWALSRAERFLGFKSDLWLCEAHKFYDNCDLNIGLKDFSIPGEIKKYSLFKKALHKYDVFHFNFGFSFLDYPYAALDYLDLPVLKKMGKKIIMTFQGDDARQKGYFVSRFKEGPYPSQNISIKDRLADWRKRERIKKIARFADKIYALNPDLLYVLPPEAEFLPYAVEKIEFSSPLSIRQSFKKTDRINIVHAPSHRFAKGTDYIIPVIKKLQDKYPLNFILVENMPQEKAKAIYAQADIAIDQLIVGWYGAFAVEMMGLGIPTIAYLRKEDLEEFVPFYQEIPVVNANKETLEKKLIILLEDASLRQKLGDLSKKYVQKYHNPLTIASHLKKVYEDLVFAKK